MLQPGEIADELCFGGIFQVLYISCCGGIFQVLYRLCCGGIFQVLYRSCCGGIFTPQSNLNRSVNSFEHLLCTYDALNLICLQFSHRQTSIHETMTCSISSAHFSCLHVHPRSTYTPNYVSKYYF